MSDKHLVSRLEQAQDIARRAGTLALQARSRVLATQGGISSKGPQDFVTEADQAVEKFIRQEFSAEFPLDSVLGEEDGGNWQGSGTWVVDPIDGTTNYIRGLPSWGVSIAYVADGQVHIGVVHDPVHAKTYAARLGHGATLNGKPLLATRMSDDISSALVILGTNAAIPATEHTRLVEHLFSAGVEYRRTGSAAIGLAMVAEGVADAYYEGLLNSWDALAGMLICREAGLQARHAGLQQHMAARSPVVAGWPDIVELICSETTITQKPLEDLATAGMLTKGHLEKLHLI